MRCEEVKAVGEYLPSLKKKSRRTDHHRFLFPSIQNSA